MFGQKDDTEGLFQMFGAKVQWLDSVLNLLYIPQALLSAHDTVAQKDYDPVLPPMPEDVPDDEEATRIVCLVKNKQPLVSQSAHVYHRNFLRSKLSRKRPWLKPTRDQIEMGLTSV